MNKATEKFNIDHDKSLLCLHLYIDNAFVCRLLIKCAIFYLRRESGSWKLRFRVKAIMKWMALPSRADEGMEMTWMYRHCVTAGQGTTLSVTDKMQGQPTLSVFVCYIVGVCASGMLSTYKLLSLVRIIIAANGNLLRRVMNGQVALTFPFQCESDSQKQKPTRCFYDEFRDISGNIEAKNIKYYYYLLSKPVKK